MKRYSIFVILFFLAALLSACGDADAPTPAPMHTPTPAPVNPGEVALTMISQRVNAEATQLAVNVQFTATAQVIGSTVTAQARIDAQATSDQQRRDAQATSEKAAYIAQATEAQRRQDVAATQARIDAQATSEQAQRNMIGTATAQQQGWINGMTAQAAPTHDMWTAQAIRQEQIIATNQVELSNLEVARQRKKNTLQALTPYAVALMLVVGTLVWLMRTSRMREVRNPDTGVVEGLVLDNKVIIRPQLMPGPVMTGIDNGTLALPMLTDPQTQKEIIARDQAIQALSAMPTSPAAGGVDMWNSMFGRADEESPYRVLTDGEQPPADLLAGDTVDMLDRDWKEGHDDGIIVS